MAALAFLIVLGLVGFVVIRYRPSFLGILALLGGAAWVGSPVDPIPEALFGPFGLADDLMVMLAMAAYVARLAARRRSERGGAALHEPHEAQEPVTYRFGTPQAPTSSSIQDDESQPSSSARRHEFSNRLS